MTDLPPTPLDLAHDDLAKIDGAMSDLQEKIAALQQAGVHLQEERDAVVAFIKMYGKYVRPIPERPTKRIQETPPGGLATLPMSTRIANFMAKYLSERDRPVELPDFYPVLEENGLVPGGSNPKQAVSAILGKDKRFTFVPKEGWKLALIGEIPQGLAAAGVTLS